MGKFKSYKCYGLVIESEINLPELEETTEKVQVEIKFGKTPERLENPMESSIRYEISKNEFLIKIDNIAKFYVAEGKSITIERLNENNDEDIKIFLYSTVFAALLQQRGYLVFHGMTAKLNNKGVVFLGNSNAGKSALAATLYEKGYSILSDELCVVKVEKGNRLCVFKGISRLYLWNDTLIQLNKDIKDFKPMRKDIKKYIYNVKTNINESMRVDKIFIISHHNLEEISTKQLLGHKKIGLLKELIYNVKAQETSIGRIELFKYLTNIGGNMKITEVKYCNNGWQMTKLSQIIEKEVSKE